MKLEIKYPPPPIGTMPQHLDPTVNEDCLLYVDNWNCGFYLTMLPDAMIELIEKANGEIGRGKETRQHRELPNRLGELAKHCEKLIRDISLIHITFTSSITCYNTPASFHVDSDKRGVNATIVTRSKDSVGGNITLPETGETFANANHSILVFPAFLFVHGVTPIEKGTRNSIIFFSKTPQPEIEPA